MDYRSEVHRAHQALVNEIGTILAALHADPQLPGHDPEEIEQRIVTAAIGATLQLATGLLNGLLYVGSQIESSGSRAPGLAVD